MAPFSLQSSDLETNYETPNNFTRFEWMIPAPKKKKLVLLW
jgi:hypothetical protein